LSHLCHRFMSLSRYYSSLSSLLYFSFNDTATTEIYTLSLHDALPIYSAEQFPLCNDARWGHRLARRDPAGAGWQAHRCDRLLRRDRKSTRLNSSHLGISYAVFCLKKKKKKKTHKIYNKKQQSQT